MGRSRSVSLSSTSSYLTLFTFLTLLTSAFSNPTADADADIDTDVLAHNVLSLSPRATKPFLLRVMPLGASITVGYRSDDGTGYRKSLREQLRFAGWEVDMVGSLKNGTMKDHENEGHYGWRIDAVGRAGLASADMQPNVILINAGTNDAIQNHDIRNAGSRMNTMLDSLYSAIPNTTIILSTLIPNTYNERGVEQISRQYRNLAATRRAAGDKLVLAEMSYFIDSSQLVDGTHPDDEGYRQMAAVWWAGIQLAESEGLLQRANTVQRSVVASLAGTNGTSEGHGLDDDGVADPGLPAYVAPAQPEDTGGAGGLSVGGIWIVGVVALLGMVV
ncbi:SGNH hydrolase-type esterase domain-containing protein [Aspergillus californicus]